MSFWYIAESSELIVGNHYLCKIQAVFYTKHKNAKEQALTRNFCRTLCNKMKPLHYLLFYPK